MPFHPAAVKQNKPFQPYSHCFKRGRCVEFALPEFEDSRIRDTVRWPSGLRRTPGKCVYVNSVPRVQIPVSPPYACFPMSKETLKARVTAGFFVCFYPLLSVEIQFHSELCN